jgi:hypothetical protein
MVTASKLSWPTIHRSAILSDLEAFLCIEHRRELAVMLGVTRTPDLTTLKMWSDEYIAKLDTMDRALASTVVGCDMSEDQWILLKQFFIRGPNYVSIREAFWPYPPSSGAGSCYERLVKVLTNSIKQAVGCS